LALSKLFKIAPPRVRVLRLIRFAYLFK
jgi:hypothetical protein